MYATSHGDNSSDDKTTSASKQVARVLQSCFNRVEKYIRPAYGISIETRSRRQRSVETASVSSKFCTVSSRASSRRRPTRGSGAEMQAEDVLMEHK